MAIALATLVYQYQAFGPTSQTNLQNALSGPYGQLGASLTALEAAINAFFGTTVASDSTTSSAGPPITATRTLVFNVGAQFNAMFPGGILDPAANAAWNNLFVQIFNNTMGSVPYIGSGAQVTLS